MPVGGDKRDVMIVLENVVSIILYDFTASESDPNAGRQRVIAAFMEGLQENLDRRVLLNTPSEGSA